MMLIKTKVWIVTLAILSLGTVGVNPILVSAQPRLIPDHPLTDYNHPIERDFTVQVASDNGINLRNSPRLDDRSNQTVQKGASLDCDAWTYGQPVKALGLETEDYRWYRLKSTNFWVPAGWVFGDAPESSPRP